MGKKTEGYFTDQIFSKSATQTFPTDRYYTAKSNVEVNNSALNRSAVVDQSEQHSPFKRSATPSIDGNFEEVSFREITEPKISKCEAAKNMLCCKKNELAKYKTVMIKQQKV